MLAVPTYFRTLTDSASHSAYRSLSAEARTFSETRMRFTRNLLVTSNSDGNGYSTSGADRSDTDSDDDDFRSGADDADGLKDNDAEAFFSYPGVIPEGETRNVFFLDPKSVSVTGVETHFLSGIVIMSDASLEATLFAFDRHSYESRGELLQKGKKVATVSA